MPLPNRHLLLSVAVAIAAGLQAQELAAPCERRETMMGSQLLSRGQTAQFDLSALSTRPALPYASRGGWDGLRADDEAQRFELAVEVDERAVDSLRAGGGGFRGIELRFGPESGLLHELILRAPSGKTVTLFDGTIRRPADGRPVMLTPLNDDDLARAGWYVPAPAATLDWTRLGGEEVAGTWTLTGVAAADVRRPLQLAGATLLFEDRLRDRIVTPAGVFATGANRYGASPRGSKTYRFSVVDAEGCVRDYAYPVQLRSDCRFRIQRVASRSPSCAGAADGQLAFVTLGESGPVSYELGGKYSSSGAFTGLPAGDYVLTVRGSGGCIIEQAVTLAEPERGFVSADWLATSCSPAVYEVSLLPTSVVGIADVSWDDNGANGFSRRVDVAPGTYRFTYRDDNGCAYADSLVLPAADQLAVAVTTVDPPCAGEGAGGIVLAPSGGVEPYGATWADFGAGLEREFAFAGDYSGTVFDARGCEVDFATTITEPNPLKIQHEMLPAVCESDQNGVVNIIARGGARPYQLRVDGGPWRPSLHPGGVDASGALAADTLRADTLRPGPHSFTLRDAAGCEVTQVHIVEPRSVLPAEFEPRVIASREPVMAGDTLRLHVGSLAAGRYSSHWAYSDAAWIACDTCSTTEIAPVKPGTVLVSIRDSLGCRTRASVPLEVLPLVSVPTGFGPGKRDPADQILRVRGRSGTVIDRFAVFDASGALVFEDVDFEVGAPRGWDGTLSGAPAPAGEYGYVLIAREPTGEVNQLKGTTTLVR